MQFALPRMSKAFLFLLVFSAMSVVHAAGSKVPASIAGLLPNSAKLFGSDWAVMNTEFGKSFSGGMNAKFSGQPLTCDLTVGPELRMTIKGDTAWEEPPMLDMAIEIFTSEIQQTRASLPGSVKTMLKTNNGVISVGGLQDEKTPLGQLLYIEFKESCNRHNGAATVLRGFSRKGATMMFFSLMQTKSAAETRAMAMEMMAKFQKLDTAALAK